MYLAGDRHGGGDVFLVEHLGDNEPRNGPEADLEEEDEEHHLEGGRAGGREGGREGGRVRKEFMSGGVRWTETEDRYLGSPNLLSSPPSLPPSPSASGGVTR